jgi:hypothetical protein
VLHQQVRAVSKQENFDGCSFDGEESLPSIRTFIKTSLLVPGRLFFTEPVVLLTSVMAATVYGIIYLFAEALTIVYLGGFSFSSIQSSLVMLAIAVGATFTFLPRLYDIRVVSRRQQQHKVLEPEDKLFGFPHRGTCICGRIVVVCLHGATSCEWDLTSGIDRTCLSRLQGCRIW